MTVYYVDDTAYNDHSRIHRDDARCAGTCRVGAGARGLVNLRCSCKCQSICVQRGGLYSPSLRGRILQCTLHTKPEGTPPSCARARAEAVGRVRSVRSSYWREGWLGAVPTTLPQRAPTSIERRRGRGFRRAVCAVWRKIPSRSIRLPSSWGQARQPERHVRQRIAHYLSGGTGKMRSALCQLSQTGASR